MPEHPVPACAHAAQYPAWGASPSVVFSVGRSKKTSVLDRIPVEAALLYAESARLFQGVAKRELHLGQLGLSWAVASRPVADGA